MSDRNLPREPIRRDAPIGVFDSGVGGLTVLRALSEALPAQDFIYLGDTARLPYGTKSPDTVSRYSLQCAQALLRRGIGALVVACNTASASALGALSARYPELPVIGVIEPGAEAAIATSSSQHIAVIATEGTINGGAYQTEIRRRNPGARVLSRACSLFVALAEEGWTSGPVAEGVAHRYLDPLFSVAGRTRYAGARMHSFSHSHRRNPRGDTATASASWTRRRRPRTPWWRAWRRGRGRGRSGSGSGSVTARQQIPVASPGLRRTTPSASRASAADSSAVR